MLADGEPVITLCRCIDYSCRTEAEQRCSVKRFVLFFFVNLLRILLQVPAFFCQKISNSV